MLEHWLNTLGWDARLVVPLITTLRIVLIVIVAFVAIAVLQRAIRTFRMRLAARMDDRESVKRAETIGRVCRYLVAVVISALAVMLVLGELGISVAPILGAAGVVGLAVGFGAQSLVKDYFTGFFLLLENQLGIGDVVQLGDHGGLVEEITLRYVRLRDYDGHVHFVPNGQITSVINMGKGYAQAVLDVGVAYRENVDEVLAVMQQVAQDMRKDPVFGPKILDDVEVVGVEKLGDSSITCRCRLRVGALEQWNVRREYFRRIKQAFDEHGIEIPFPHLTVWAGQPKEGSVPAFRVQALGQALQVANG